ncbi:TMEM164 family acyltransferase [Mycoplasma seminis]|uniref:YwaF family protein n=1 Tax=Mycoplasma seminis TaxID=512749 RepID=A0ABY9HAE9_9MOLU|nr:YwaF family protein [Mycoplasma seminis]WLP85169.1 YwaF family protein [Mycoplasma seminis]
MNWEEKYWYLQHSFLSWTGTNGNDAGNLSITLILMKLNLVFIVLFVFLFWLFKRQIYAHWIKHQPSAKIQEILIRSVGFLLLLGMFLRSLNMGLTSYPRIWESIPLHFCRLVGLCIGIILLLNKTQWMKYVAAPAYLGAFVALAIPDVKIVFTPNETFSAFGENFVAGQDKIYHVAWNNVYFYDLIGLHSFMIISSLVVSILYPYKMSKKDVVIQSQIFAAFFLVNFTINAFTDALAPIEWKSNYMYCGMDQYNGFSNLLGPLLHWPWSLITLMLIGLAYFYFAAWIFDLQDKICFNFKKGKKFIEIKPSTKGFMSSFKAK